MTRTRLLATLGIWGVAVLSLWASDAEPAILILGGIVAAIAATAFAAFDLAVPVRAVKWPRRRSWTPQPTRVDQRAATLRRQAREAARRDTTELHDALIELVDDRLMVQHGIDRSQSSEAGVVLSPALTRLVDGPRRRTATVRELHQIVSDIEEL